MLKYRLLTAAVLIPLTLWAIFSLSGPGLALFTGFFILIAAWEWAALAECDALPARLLYLMLTLATMAALYLFLDTPFLPLALACGWWLAALLWVWDYQHGALWLPEVWKRRVLGLVVLVPAWFAVLVLHNFKGPLWLVFFLFLIWSADSGAYFVGRSWGQRKLAAEVSPGKTWEGVLGGMTAGLFLGLTFALWQEMNGLMLFGFLLLCGLTLAASVLGDLFESVLKRLTGVKDSGRLLPGHGGVLDRIDSLTAAAPLFVWGLYLMEGRI